MVKKKIIFRLTAFSAAAGKYNPEAPLDGNEDNFYVDDDLSDDVPGRFQSDVDVSMSDCGCLMVVADGMGGMNAGEVASEIAIDTVKDYFSPGKINPKMAESPAERRRYLELVIKEADRRIKKDAKENPAHEGMGSTIILAWIVGDKLTLSWCGDSRAYRFNPTNGLEPLSRDHSFVQELVNQGALRYEDTFEHPQGNIVTRSLGDPNNSAKPETKQYEVYNEDIILLCSDGLSGVLRDRKTKDANGNFYPGENIEDIMASHTSSMTECRDALLDAAEKADWYDNVTVLLCQIERGASKAPKITREEKHNSVVDSEGNKRKHLRSKILLWSGCLLFLVVILCGAFYYLGTKKGDNPINVSNNDSNADTISSGSVVVGEDIKETKTSNKKTSKKEKTDNGNNDKKEAKRKEPKPDKAIEPGQSSSSVIPHDAIVTPVWKTVMITKLKNYSQPVLKKVVASVVETISTASDDDEKKCQGLVDQVKTRSDCLNDLVQFNGKLTKTGQKKFDAIYAEIGNPSKYNPKYWRKATSELRKDLKKDANGGSSNELSPIEENTGGGSELQDLPSDLIEI